MEIKQVGNAMVGSNAIAEDFTHTRNTFNNSTVFSSFSFVLHFVFRKVCQRAAVHVCLFLPSSSYSLRVARGQANNLGDVHPADGGGASLALIEAQEAALQRAPPAGHLWKWNMYVYCQI